MSWCDYTVFFRGGDVDGCVYNHDDPTTAGPTAMVRLTEPYPSGEEREFYLDGWDEIEGLAKALRELAAKMRGIAAENGLLKTTIAGGVMRVLMTAALEVEYQSEVLFLPKHTVGASVLETKLYWWGHRAVLQYPNGYKKSARHHREMADALDSLR